MTGSLSSPDLGSHCVALAGLLFSASPHLIHQHRYTTTWQNQLLFPLQT